MHFPKKIKSVSLLEVILSIAIMVVIMGFSVPVYGSLKTKTDLDNATNHFVNAMRRAQISARGMASDSNWGVKFETGKITIFRGESFDTRTQSSDETIEISPQIGIAGTDEIIFSKFSGNPASATTSTLNFEVVETRTINVNEKGTISY